MTYKQALRFLDSFVNYEKKDVRHYPSRFHLTCVRNLLALLGNPHRTLRSILVGGTNGKGSTAAILQSMVAGMGYRVGLYTSPHLVDVRERIRINERSISRQAFTACCAVLQRCIKQKWHAPRYGGRLTYFEVLTALALYYFQRAGVDYAIVEVGLGGRLDATNVLEPLCSIITAIGHDHTHLLGSTLGRIAREKAGIIKHDSWLISARQKPAAHTVLERYARQQNTQTLFYDRDFTLTHAKSTRAGCSFRYENYGNLTVPLRGRFQLENSALALRALQLLHDQYGLRVRPPTVRRALRQVSWPGRFELIRKPIPMILDGAHNPEAVSALVDTVRETFPHQRVTLLVGMSRDKQYTPMLRTLRRLSPTIIITQSTHERAGCIDDIRKVAVKFFPSVITQNSLAAAVHFIYRSPLKNTLVVVTGSLFIVGETKRLVRRVSPV